VRSSASQVAQNENSCEGRLCPPYDHWLSEGRRWPLGDKGTVSDESESSRGLEMEARRRAQARCIAPLAAT
jgi:hypothetical protein